jgi:hypothetical protein
MRPAMQMIQAVNGMLTAEECSRAEALAARTSDIHRRDAEWLFALIERGIAPGLALCPRAVLQVMTPGCLCQLHTDTAIEPRAVCSVSLLLADCEAGGRLIVAGSELPRRLPGDAVFYSSELAHEVSLVTAGRRATLIFWAGRALGHRLPLRFL